MFKRSYPTISDWVNDILGTSFEWPIQSFGFFVAIAFLTAAYVVSRDMKRMESLGYVSGRRKKIIIGKGPSTYDLIINGLIGFIIGFKLVAVLFDYASCVADPQGFVFSLEGNFIGGIAGAAVAAFFKYREKSSKKLDEPKEVTVEVKPHEMVGDMLIIAAVAGFIGAKVFNFFEAPDDFRAFLQDPGGNLFSGLTIYGGLIFGAIGVMFYAHKNKLNMFHLADAAAPAVMLAYGIGRIGCHVAGDGDWGIENTAAKPDWLAWLPDKMWAYKYPHNILGECSTNVTQAPVCPNISDCPENYDYCSELVNPVFPTPIYETIMAVAIFGILWGFRKKIKIPGMIMALYLIFNGVERFLIEKIRVNSEYDVFGLNLTQAEIISPIFVLGGIGFAIYLKKRYDHKKGRGDLNTTG